MLSIGAEKLSLDKEPNFIIIYIDTFQYGE